MSPTESLGNKLREAVQQDTLDLLSAMMAAGFSYEQAAKALSPVMFGLACRLATDAGVSAESVHAAVDNIFATMRAQAETKA